MIKNVLVGILGMGAIIAMAGVCGYIETHYDKEATVVEINGDEITAVDKFDHEWVFVGDGFEEGDNITLKMYNGHTDNIMSDDEIVGVER